MNKLIAPETTPQSKADAVYFHNLQSMRFSWNILRYHHHRQQHQQLQLLRFVSKYVCGC